MIFSSFEASNQCLFEIFDFPVRSVSVNTLLKVPRKAFEGHSCGS